MGDLAAAAALLESAESGRRPPSSHGHAAVSVTPAVPSIVVLPFTNRSPDVENEYFSDGLTEEIIADLSKVGALRVISKLSLIHISEPTRLLSISYAVFC